MNALLIDLDGVLYEGESAVDGAADAVNALRERGIPQLFLTNTTSRPRSAIVDKLAGMGLDVAADSLLTPPVAAARWLQRQGLETVALFVDPATAEDFGDLSTTAGDDAEVDAVVVGDYGERWNFPELNRAFRYLVAEPQPALVALGMTRYWKAEDGLRLDTAPFVVALSHASGVEPVVLGKPAAAFFEAALEMLEQLAPHFDAVVYAHDDKGARNRLLNRFTGDFVSLSRPSGLTVTSHSAYISPYLHVSAAQALYDPVMQALSRRVDSSRGQPLK